MLRLLCLVIEIYHAEPAKDNIRSRIASTIQSASITDSNLTKDERQALKRLKTDEDIVILPADKGRVTVVMDKTDYYDKMDTLVNDKQTYEELKRDPTPALQRRLNGKLLSLKKDGSFDITRYYRLRSSVPQPPKLYGLPKLHKPNVPMRPIVSFCGSPTYQLSKYLTTILQPLTDESRHKLQSTENFINAIKTVQIPHDHKLVSFDVKSLFTSIPLQLALDCTETAINNSTFKLPLPTNDIMDLLNHVLLRHIFSTTASTTDSYTALLWAHRSPLLLLKLSCRASRNRPLLHTNKQYHFGYATSTTLLLLYTKTRLTPFTNTSTDKTLTFNLLGRLKKMVRFLF